MREIILKLKNMQARKFAEHLREEHPRYSKSLKVVKVRKR